MTHDELLARIDSKFKYCDCDGWGTNCWGKENIPWQALRAVVELHEPYGDIMCVVCEGLSYPCSTIQAIESALQ